MDQLRAIVRILWCFGLCLTEVIPASAATQDYCALDAETVLIFVDRTTEYDEQDRALFVGGAEQIFDSLSMGERVNLYTIGSHYSESRVAFSRCMPGCPEVNIVEWLSSKCRPLQARADRDRFQRDLVAVIRGMLQEIQSHPRSDIARTIAEVSQAESRSAAEQGHHLSTVYVFSDLIENSDVFPWPEILGAGTEDAMTRLRDGLWLPQFEGSKVVVFGFGRLHDKNRTPLAPEQDRELRQFWVQFFREGGAISVSIGQRVE